MTMMLTHRREAQASRGAEVLKRRLLRVAWEVPCHGLALWSLLSVNTTRSGPPELMTVAGFLLFYVAFRLVIRPMNAVRGGPGYALAVLGALAFAAVLLHESARVRARRHRPATPLAEPGPIGRATGPAERHKNSRLTIGSKNTMILLWGSCPARADWGPATGPEGAAAMLECCILFMHHRADAVTSAHLELLRENNPYPVVAITDQAESRIAGSFDAARPEWGYVGDTWFNADTPTYRWFRHGGVRAERYIYLEWDALATMPVREYYEEVWHEDAAASRVERIEDQPGWGWFCLLDLLPPELRPHAAGLAPLNGVLLSDRALSTLADAPPLPGVHCELRMGTILRHAGFKLTRFPSHRSATNEWHPSLRHLDRDRPGIYHPVKD